MARLWQICPAALLAVLALAFSASAQEQGMAPLPAQEPMQRITPLNEDPHASQILSTKPIAPAAATPAPAAELPWQQNAAPTPAAPTVAKPPAAAPFGRPGGGANNYLPAKVPFGRATPRGPEIPSGPHTSVAAPVEDIGAVEVTEPAAPPSPVAAGADPVAENPEEPTEFNSPIFDGTDDAAGGRKVVFRVLNKVTAQAGLFKAKLGEIAKFGQLEIIAENCRNSAPNSQADAAGLLTIREHLPGDEGVRSLFHGWMYASSPSIAALEHPIYDVTMVRCDLPEPAPKETPAAPAKKTAKSKKK